MILNKLLIILITVDKIIILVIKILNADYVPFIILFEQNIDISVGTQAWRTGGNAPWSKNNSTCLILWSNVAKWELNRYCSSSATGWGVIRLRESIRMDDGERSNCRAWGRRLPKENHLSWMLEGEHYNGCLLCSTDVWLNETAYVLKCCVALF